ncbi:hypothetical protein TWF730_007153 [Orbilia blumenaviensis]|uniref:T6SS Phospholipase effector Tle1-like catalytic domain-containing protein n=1 Tax=Orbilia blumenaviensis TaxID=1796055 RepID=A0AAV9VIS9_9PEZI
MLGLDEKVKEAYAFICHNYVQDAGDEIILIGFSRGAFIVRCVADLITKVGLLEKVGLFYLDEVYMRWRDHGARLAKFNTPETYCERNNITLLKVRIKVCAVWDTVSSIGIPWPRFFGLVRPGGPNFVHSDLCDGIEHAIQALSLHEHRYHFHPLVWRRPPGATHPPISKLEQCWFQGYHADIGGGNECESLAHFALVWVIAKLENSIGFDYDNFWKPEPRLKGWVLNSPDPLVQNPVTAFYRLGGFRERKPGAQFWTALGLEEIAPQDLQRHTDKSVLNEKMHSTVRFLEWLRTSDDSPLDPKLVDRKLPPCPLLRNVQPMLASNPTSQIGTLTPDDQEPTVWFWELPFSGPLSVLRRVWRNGLGFLTWRSSPPATYRLNEEKMSDREKELLRRWVRQDHMFILQKSVMGADRPNTLIPDLESWLNREDN